MSPRLVMRCTVLALALLGAGGCATSRLVLGDVAPVPDAQYRSAVVDLTTRNRLEERIGAAAAPVLPPGESHGWNAFKAGHAPLLAAIMATGGVTRTDLVDESSALRRAFVFPEGDEPAPRFRGFDSRFTVASPLGSDDLAILVAGDLAFAFYFVDPRPFDAPSTPSSPEAADLPP